MSDKIKRTLAIGFYHPTDKFFRFAEHICVMDTSKPLPSLPSIASGELVALFGPSLAAGGSEESVAQSYKDVRLFLLAEKMLTACIHAEECLSGAVLEHSRGCLSRKGEGCDCWLPVRRDVLVELREILALAEGQDYECSEV